MLPSSVSVQISPVAGVPLSAIETPTGRVGVTPAPPKSVTASDALTVACWSSRCRVSVAPLTDTE